MFDELTDEQLDLVVEGMGVADTCSKFFTSPEALKRLRESSGLRTKQTPAWATWREFRQFTTAGWGIAGEAVALTLYHLAANEGKSGEEIERLRDAVELYWKYVP